MIPALTPLIATLREELQSYGELLALLDRQQDLVMARAAGELFQTVTSIQAQSALLEEVRVRRDHCRRTMAEDLQMPSETPFGLLIPRLPADYQPLLEALVQENNELLVRVQQRARQNHLLLSRSVELMQRLIASLLPGRDAGLYSETGPGPRMLPTSVVFNAVG